MSKANNTYWHTDSDGIRHFVAELGHMEVGPDFKITATARSPSGKEYIQTGFANYTLARQWVECIATGDSQKETVGGK